MLYYKLFNQTFLISIPIIILFINRFHKSSISKSLNKSTSTTDLLNSHLPINLCNLDNNSIRSHNNIEINLLQTDLDYSSSNQSSDEESLSPQSFNDKNYNTDLLKFTDNKSLVVHTINSFININKKISHITFKDQQCFLNNCEMVYSVNPTNINENLNNEIINFLFDDVLIKDINTSKKTIIEISDDIDIYSALNILSKNNVSCVPVFNLNKDIKEYIGILNIANIASFINYEQLQNPGISTNLILNFLNKIFSINENDNIRNLIYLMKQDIKHVIILDNYNQINKIISQGSLFNFIYYNFLNNELNYNFNNIFNQKISDFKIIYERNNKIKYIDEDTLTYKAFEIMTHNNLSSIPIINKSGLLTGVLSLSDIKLLSLKMDINILKLPAKVYSNYNCVNINEIRKKKKKIITCNLNDNLKKIIHKLIFNKIHQIFIVNREKLLINYISYSDILKILF